MIMRIRNLRLLKLMNNLVIDMADRMIVICQSYLIYNFVLLDTMSKSCKIILEV